VEEVPPEDEALQAEAHPEAEEGRLAEVHLVVAVVVLEVEVVEVSPADEAAARGAAGSAQEVGAEVELHKPLVVTLDCPGFCRVHALAFGRDTHHKNVLRWICTGSVSCGGDGDVEDRPLLHLHRDRHQSISKFPDTLRSPSLP
jgi:hypothetical protein